MPAIVIADANELIRECVAVLINEVPDFDVVGQCSDGRRLMKTVEADHPDIAIVAANLPDLDIPGAARLIRKLSPATRTIALTNYPSELDAASHTGSGISGEIHKGGTVKELVETIRNAMRDPSTPGAAAKHGKSGGPQGFMNCHPLETLTPRECEVLKLIGEGLSSKEIAAKLDISETTVKTYRNHLMDKLDVREVAGLTRESVRLKLVRIEYD